MHDYVYMIKWCGGFVAVKDFTLRVTFSQNPRCQLWFNSWMSLIKITKQHVATWSEHVWLISVTVDAVYKVCPCRWWWYRNSSQMQPSSWLAGLNVEHLSHVCRWRLVNSCSDKGLCKFKWHQKSFFTPLIHDSSNGLYCTVMAVNDVSSFFQNGADISWKMEQEPTDAGF